MDADECRATVLAADAAYHETVIRIQSRLQGGQVVDVLPDGRVFSRGPTLYDRIPDLVEFHPEVVAAARIRDMAIERAEVAYYSSLDVPGE